MPTITDISLTLGVDNVRVFKPKAVAPGSASFEDRSGGVAIGYDQMVVSTEDLPNVRRVKLHFRVNHIATPTGADAQGFTPGPRLDRYDEVDVIFKANRRSGLVDRENLIGLVTQALANVDVLAVLKNEEEIL